MVGVSICGMCKYYHGLSDDKTKLYCDAFPDGDGITIVASTVKECKNGFNFEAAEEHKELCSDEVFIRKFA